MIPQHAHNAHFARSGFERALDECCPSANRAEQLTSLMLNVGLQCNLSCELCHHSCTPQRTETMSRGVMLDALQFASDLRPELLDITGGEPTMWPHLRELVQLGRNVATRMRVRTNLDALLLPEFATVAPTLAENRVEILASLPEALEGRTIGRCVEALSWLTRLGYGDPDLGDSIAVDLAYNPLPGEMPRPQEEIAREFRAALAPHGIRFRSLLAITNVPIGGFAEWLEETNERERYRAGLRDAFNPDVLPRLACRHGIEIAWDGTLWDCDFNLAAGMPLAEGSVYVGDYLGSPVGQLALATRRIHYAEHCFACSAGSGSG
jgi:radical SAM/Cys-rich protein